MESEYYNLKKAIEITGEKRQRISYLIISSVIEPADPSSGTGTSRGFSFQNLLEIEVTNLSANRIRDLDTRKVDWRIFHDINFVNHNYKNFDASKWPLTPSGLLGPVRMTPMKVPLGY